MQIIEGQYNTAKVFTEHVEENAAAQIHTLCDQMFVKGSKIRVMLDVHAGVGCTIGTTMTIGDKIVPNLVGVDIGCGMETVQLRNQHLELQKLDTLIREKFPLVLLYARLPMPMPMKSICLNCAVSRRFIRNGLIKALAL